MTSGELRHRKLQDDNGEVKRPSPKKSRRTFSRSRYWKIFSMMLLAGIFLICIYSSYMGVLVDGLAKAFGLQKHEYAIIIDAGSSGSRVLAYKFARSYMTDQLNVEDDELFIQLKPGLSSFPDDPEKGADTIQQLVEAAKRYIPENAHAHTPIMLRATAGLRLLSIEKANAILEACTRRLDATDFITGPDTVTIMDGYDEGIFSWYTVNLLDDKINTGSPTLPTLDLGGGSMQVTFEPSSEVIAKLPKENLRIISTLKKNITLYSYSYLKLGLQAFRKGVWVREEGKGVSEPTNITSSCVNPVVKDASFAYANIQYYISGALKSKPESVDSPSCQKAQEEIFKERVNGRSTLKLPADSTTAAMSYFFDMVADAGMIHPVEGGMISLSDLQKTMKFICDTPNEDQPFACFDMMYMDLLMRQLLGLTDSSEINLYKKRKGHEVSWALGLAYHTLVNGVISNVTSA